MDRSSASAPEHEPMIASAKHAAFAFSISPLPRSLFLIPCPQRDCNGSRCVYRIRPYSKYRSQAACKARHIRHAPSIPKKQGAPLGFRHRVSRTSAVLGKRENVGVDTGGPLILK